MNPHRNKKKYKKLQAETQNPKSLIDILILLMYGYVAIITPNLKAYDSNGTKFLALSVLNLVVWTYIIFKKDNYFSEYTILQFFKTKIGLAFGLFMLVSLLSFVKAINVAESIVPFFKMFTTFTAAWIVAIILIRDLNYLKYLAIGMAVLLLFDSLRVFNETLQYVNGEISSISLIKAGYSNKNILAAALFIKLVFGLWMFTFFKKWLKWFGLSSVFSGILAILFMSARAFYLGLIFLSVVYLAFILIRFIQTKENYFLRNALLYFSGLIIAFLIFTVVQTTFYPKNQKGYNKSVAGRLATVSDKDAEGGRLKHWQFTGDLIKKNPVLGIGLGNWKIHVVEFENSYKGDFKSFYKTHNDFLEITAESGIMAGILYISLSILVFYTFLTSLFKKESETNVKLLFIPAFGLFAYIFDAFFNFPHDRPEIQSLYAIFLGIGAAFFSIKKCESVLDSANINPSKNSGKSLQERWNAPVQIAWLVISIGAVYFLLLNFNMLKVQRIWKNERDTQKVIVNSEYFINNFPKIPTLGADGAEPVKMMIVKKLYSEQKYEEMLQVLHTPYPNPYDSKLEFFSGLAHLGLNNQDSALYYFEKAYYKKPFAYLYAKQYCNLLEKNGEVEKAKTVLEEFLAKDKKEKDAWMYYGRLNSGADDKQKVIGIIDSALVYFPMDTTLLKLKKYYNPEQ